MGHVTLLCGSMGSGKTQHIIEQYVSVVRENGSDAALLLVPTTRIVSQVSRRLLATGAVTGLVDVRILTFPSLADMLLRANNAQAPEISDMQRWLLMSQVIARLNREKRLRGLGSSVDTPGIVDAMLSFIDELKRAAISPEQFSEGLAQAGFVRLLDEALAAVYAEYQQVLTQNHLYDTAGKFWQARDLLAEGKIVPLEQMKCVLVDGFSDFTTTELQVTARLASLADETTISVPLNPDETREEVRILPERTLTRIQSVLDELGISVECQHLPANDDGGLAFLRSNLFALSSSEPSEGCAKQVHLLVAESLRDEIRTVAAKVKTLLLDGVPASDICLASRQPGKHRDLIAQIFDELGIPHYFSEEDQVINQPLVRTVMSLLAVQSGDFRLEDVVNFLRGNLVDISPLQNEDGCPDADTVFTIACRAGIVGGRVQWGEGLQLYGRRLTAHRDALTQNVEADAIDDDIRMMKRLKTVDRELRDVERVHQLILQLAEAIDDLPEEAAVDDHVTALVGLLGVFGLHAEGLAGRQSGALLSSANLRAFDQLCCALADYRDTERLGLLGRKLKRGQFISELTQVLTRLRYRPHRQRQGRIEVLNVHDLRQLRVPHILLIDMSQGSFPLPPRQDPFYSDDDRARLSAEAGFDLRSRPDTGMSESFLFLEAIAAATSDLHLSHTDTGNDGNPILASQYFEEIERLVGTVRPVVRRSKTPIVSRPAEAYSMQELRECVLGALAGEASGVTVGVPAGPDETQTLAAYNFLVECEPQVLLHALQSSYAEIERFSFAPFGCYDGVLDEPQLIDHLAGQWGSDHLYSPSQLSDYGACPFRFFATRVLGLQRTDGPVEEADRRLLGSLLHRILAQFVRTWVSDDSHEPAITRDNTGQAQQLLKQCAEDILQSHERSNLVAHPRLWAISREQLLADLAVVPLCEAKANDNKDGHLYVPQMVEAGYSYDGNPELVLGDDQSVRIGGRVDRLDRVLDASGQAIGFAVFDYKTSSSLPTFGQIESGQELQLPIYIMAGQLLLGDDQRGLDCLLACYYQIRNGVAKWKARIEPDSKRYSREVLIESARENIIKFVESIRAGRFPVSPGDVNSCRFCEMKTICRYAQWRCCDKTGGGRNK